MRPALPPQEPIDTHERVQRPVAAPAIAVSVIVPTYNEAGNIETLLDRLTAVLGHTAHEIIVVDDDSPDGTWRLASERALTDPAIRVVRRVGRRGLSSAVLEGMDAANGQVLAVLDGDLQHDEAILPDMVAAVLRDEADVCLGSRNAPGGSYGEFGPVRRFLSFGGAQLARGVLGVRVSDPMSGYFAVSRERLDLIRPAINPRGFKILLDVLANGPRPRVAEVGYRFRSRRQGETKLDRSVMGSYLVALGELALTRLRAATFLNYAAVAVTGLSTRVTATSLAAALSDDVAWRVLATELALLAEFVGHDRYTFARAERPALTPGGRLWRFHLVVGHTLLAQAGVGAVVSYLTAGQLATGLGLVPILAVATGGVVATLTAAYHLNARLTWPLSSAGR